MPRLLLLPQISGELSKILIQNVGEVCADLYNEKRLIYQVIVYLLPNLNLHFLIRIFIGYIGTAMFFFKTRLKIGKFLKLTNPSNIQFIFRKPSLSIEQNIYSLPFSWPVWISSIGLIVLIIVLLILSSFYENPRNEVHSITIYQSHFKYRFFSIISRKV